MITVRGTDVLEDAIKLLDERGWAQGTWVSPTGKVCGMTAVRYACTRQYGPSVLFYELREALDAVAGQDGFESFVDFNDDAHTTLEDVKLVIKLTIARLEGGETNG